MKNRKTSWLSGYVCGLSVGALSVGVTIGSLFWLGTGVALFFASNLIPSDPIFPRRSRPTVTNGECS